MDAVGRTLLSDFVWYRHGPFGKRLHMSSTPSLASPQLGRPKFDLIRAGFVALLAIASASVSAHVPILDLDHGPSAFFPNPMLGVESRPAHWVIDAAGQASSTWRRQLVTGEGCVLVLQNAGEEPAVVTIVISQDDAGQPMPGTRPVSFRIAGHGRHALTLQAAKPLSVSVYVEGK